VVVADLSVPHTSFYRPSVRLTTGNRPRTFDNRNTLVRARSWINGVKSGHTSQAGYVLVGSGKKKGIQLVSAVLGTPSVAARDAATLAILDDSFGKFQTITAVRRGTVMTRVPIRYRRGAELALVAGRTVKRIVPRGQRDDVTRRIVGRPDDVTGPIVAGQAFGAIEILQNGRVVGRVPLVAASSIPAADLEQKAKSWFTSPLPLLLVVALIGGTVLVGRQLVRGRHHELLDVGSEEVGRDADVVLVDVDVPPGHHPLALLLHGALEQALQLGAAIGLVRQEAHADAIGPGRRQVLVEHGAHERIGHLEQDPGAVARVRIGARRPAVLEVLQRHDRAPDRLVRRLAVEPRDEGDAAGVVLVAWVVKANRLGRPRHA